MKQNNLLRRNINKNKNTKTESKNILISSLAEKYHRIIQTIRKNKLKAKIWLSKTQKYWEYWQNGVNNCGKNLIKQITTVIAHKVLRCKREDISTVWYLGWERILMTGLKYKNSKYWVTWSKSKKITMKCNQTYWNTNFWLKVTVMLIRYKKAVENLLVKLLKILTAIQLLTLIDLSTDWWK